MLAQKRKRQGEPLEGQDNHGTSLIPASASGSDTGPTMSLKPKRRRQVRGRRGCLEGLPHMPLDIVFEACGGSVLFLSCLTFSRSLPTSDLLNLSRISKDLRGLLMSKSSERFWKAARLNVDGLPDCPPFLSEPAFANLLFLNYCHKCLKPNVKTSQWALRTRLCNTCILSETVQSRWLAFPARWAEGELRYGYKGVLPSHVPERRRTVGVRCLPSDRSALEQKMREAADSGVTLYQFEETESVLVQQISNFEWACQDWQKRREDARANDLKDIKMMRLQAVIQRLRDCGWGAELDHIAHQDYKQLTMHKVVQEGKPLTDRAWTKLRGPVEELMKTVREALQKAERLKSRFKVAEEVLHSWRQKFDALFPHIRQFVGIPEVRAILESPDSVSLTAEHFDVLKPTLLELISRWREDAQQRFFNQLIHNKRCYEGIGDDEASSLARTWLFYCRRCDCHTSYPEVLTHHCNRDDVVDCKDADYSLTANFVFRTQPPSPSSIFGSSNIVVRTIRLCGLNPNKATQSDMDALAPRFCSTEHLKAGGYVVITDWRGISRTRVIIKRPGKVKLLSEEDAARARALEDATSNEGTHLPGRLCAHCPQLASSSHFTTVHNIADPVESDYFRHPDTPPRAVPIVCFVTTNTPTEKLPYRVRELMKVGRAEYRDIQLDEKVPAL